MTRIILICKPNSGERPCRSTSFTGFHKCARPKVDVIDEKERKRTKLVSKLGKEALILLLELKDENLGLRLTSPSKRSQL